MDKQTNRTLFHILYDSQSNLNDHKKLLQLLVSKNIIKTSVNNDIENKDKLQERLRLYCCTLYKRWQSSSRTCKAFLEKNVEWLDLKFIAETTTESVSTNKFSDIEIQQSSKRAYSPTKKTFKSWDDISDKQKRRRTSSLIEAPIEELKFALTVKAKKEGELDLAAVMQYLQNHPESIKQIKDFCYNGYSVNWKQFSREKALALFISTGLTKAKYCALRNSAIEEGTNIYPSYYQIQVAKSRCYPPKDKMHVTDYNARVELQAILDVTTEKILETPNVENFESTCKLTLISKWGFDGASGQSLYNQSFQDNYKNTDASVFLTCFVPIQLITESNKVIWKNKEPSSTRLCRPISFSFMKESPEIIKTEKGKMDEEIKKLVPTKLFETVEVHHKLLFTMVDGKICSTLSDASSCASCYICGATPKQMNDLENISKRIANEDHYQYGMSSLHCLIKCCEMLFHVACKMDTKKWSSRQKENKEKQAERKKLLQQNLRDKLGILIDVIKQGVGTTNNGNMARKFFSDPEKTASILNLDPTLVRRFAIILQTISSGEKINISAFDDFAKKTAEVFVEMYGWYYLPATVHKLLFHGADIIKTFLVPIGMLSEEALEARHKEFRKIRENHTRKCSREACNEDILKQFLITSDPFISSIRPKMSEVKKKSLFSEVFDLLDVNEDF